MWARVPLLAEVRSLDVTFLALVASAASGDAVYWTGYHAFFAVLCEHHHRGQQLAAREAIAAATGLAGPLVIGFTLSSLGPLAASGATAARLAASALPLLATPRAPVAREALGASEAGMRWASRLSDGSSHHAATA